MPSFQDSIFLFLLALMLLGPKRLPALAREMGKWIGEFRRASNEFKMQMEEELRNAEQAEKQKKMEAIAESAPPPTEPVPEPTPSYDVAPHLADSGDGYPVEPESAEPESAEPEPVEHVAIATAGDVTMRPPETGLPVAQSHDLPVSSESVTAETDARPAEEAHAEPTHSEASHG